MLYPGFKSCIVGFTARVLPPNNYKLRLLTTAKVVGQIEEQLFHVMLEEADAGAGPFPELDPVIRLLDAYVHRRDGNCLFFRIRGTMQAAEIVNCRLGCRRGEYKS